MLSGTRNTACQVQPDITDRAADARPRGGPLAGFSGLYSAGESLQYRTGRLRAADHAGCHVCPGVWERAVMVTGISIGACLVWFMAVSSTGAIVLAVAAVILVRAPRLLVNPAGLPKPYNLHSK